MLDPLDIEVLHIFWGGGQKVYIMTELWGYNRRGLRQQLVCGVGEFGEATIEDRDGIDWGGKPKGASIP